MRSNTPKRARQERQYRLLREAFLDANPGCQRCGRRATEVHHKRGRVGLLLTMVEHFAAMCHDCHAHVTLNPAVAYAEGWSERRVGT